MEENQMPLDYTVEKEQKLLKSSYEMYEKTLTDTKERLENELDENTGERKYSDAYVEDRLKLIKEAESDIIQKFIQNGGTMEELSKPEKKKRTRKSKQSSIIEEAKNEMMDSAIKSAMEEVRKPVKKDLPTKKEASQATFDVIPLPSKGECYPNKISKVPVSFLTAYDENIIVSPNLYKENMVIDYILSEKIMNDDIDPDLLLDGDRDAIILYLRAAGYGNEYPVTATDNVTGEEFETVVDLSDIKFKDFNLKGDENGYFDYTLPVSGKQIKFRFLNHKENKALDEISKLEMKGFYKHTIDNVCETLDKLMKNDDVLAGPDKIKAKESIKTIKEWSSKISEEEGLPYSRLLTNKLEMEIMSIDGDADRKKIRDFVKNMNVRDSSSLRRYINDNEPGLDFTFKVQKPESLGGGSMEIFLELDQFIFLNIPEQL